ncbi:protein DpdJ [Mesorhizobium sp. M0676]|uniref:protein DpdJ n=1 Tax=Mesorhizobium sp. M0676 TaxID=2956984 RepID=UPI0033350919
MTSDDALLITVLDQMEQQEARLLSWGLVDAFLTGQELREIIDDALNALPSFDGLTILHASDVLEKLLQRTLVFDVGEEPGERFRSRMAEGVRLMFRLRQLFPKHSGPIGWQDAPTLVADFRFIWRRRRYPKRTISADAAIAEIAEALGDHEARSALDALVRGYGSDFTLSKFQVAATKRILSGLDSPSSQATLVSAGTGSGKTLAFYLPAMAQIAAHIRRDRSDTRWVKVLALYPRNELLKDQFAEVYSQARALDATLAAQGKRKVLIATFFGPTPANMKAAEHGYGDEKRGKWPDHRDGIVCESMRCPTEGCQGNLVWLNEDRKRNLENLRCDACGHRIREDEIILTRERLNSESPDILFTTTEMLNQRMADSETHHLFGLGAKVERPVEMMLLDEVHTYSGRSGAQVAFLLRRWRTLLRKPVSFVGLSATLRDGAKFLAQLTGLPEQASVEITTIASDMIDEGAEYMLALRGDPVSQAALMSTTIQAAMLTSRILDNPRERKSHGVFGERLFLFTDDLDVTNRMYYAMLDAEGRNSWGNFDTQNHPQGGLAILRRPAASLLRKSHGQDWQAPLDIGHELNGGDRKAVGRVMSLDPGVGQNLDIVVATAALEVGYNDPLVGAVIQHKAPRDVAQFLQRKGRAGRPRRMRPWTIVVLSDYGRDRIAYQGYDLLFDPELAVRTLPTGNRYVRRIQSVYATLDYLGQQLDAASDGSVWRNLSGPTTWRADTDRQARMVRAITRILSEPAERDRYAAFLGRALRLADKEVALLLWDYPRPLLTEVLPTALRRLETAWRTEGSSPETVINNSPLPEFAPANLFSDLNLPEVLIALPSRSGQTPAPQVMPILQAMRDFAPGRVSRRFALNHAAERHWVCPTLDTSPRQSVALASILEAEPLGEWAVTTDIGIFRYPVHRPLRIITEQTPHNILDTSQARLEWRTQIVARASGLVLEMPQRDPWSSLVSEVRFFTHQNLAPVEVRRFAVASAAEIKYKNGSTAQKTFTFEADGNPAAVGYSLNTDALCLKLAHPEALWSSLGGEGSALYRAMRTARFHHQATRGPYLASVDNVFAREWLAHLLLAALSNEAIAKSISLREAAENLATGVADLSLGATLTILFQSAVVDDADAHGNTQDKLRQSLSIHLANPAVVADLHSLAAILWTPVSQSWEPWLQERFSVTVAAAAMNAIASLCPDIDVDSLVVDIDAGPREPDDVFAASSREIWISELSPGGNGLIEDVLKQYADDPRRFFSLMTAALRDNDFLLSDFQMVRFLEELETHPGGDIAGATARYRSAYGAKQSHVRLTELRHTLAAEGYVTFHAFVVAVANRILRPGSGPASDSFLLAALTRWSSEEVRLGVELDARVIAYRLARRADIDAALVDAGIEVPTINPDQWRFSVIYSLLWPRGAHIRRSGLSLYSAFRDLPSAEPLLLKPHLGRGLEVIAIHTEGWEELCLARLAIEGAATLICPMNAASDLADALSFLATNPVQADYLSVYARVQAVRRVQDAFEIDLDIAEAVQ